MYVCVYALMHIDLLLYVYDYVLGLYASDTMWASHKRAVQAVLRSLPCIIDTLQTSQN